MLFRSAVDSWFYMIVVSLPVVILSAIIPILLRANSAVIALVIAICLPAMLLPAWLLFTTYYRVDSSILHIQSGPFAWSVPVEQIRAITASRSFISSPALSLNRLKIDYGTQKSILVSPRDRVAFIEALGHQPADVIH